MSGPAFLDTNILVYAALQSDHRSDAARRLLAGGGLISVQVLNEFTNVAYRKLRRPWLEITRAVEAICYLCPPPLPLTLATHQAARRIAEGTGFAFYDALIVASALEAKCGILYSEDLQDGQVIEGRLTVRNPFGAE